MSTKKNYLTISLIITLSLILGACQTNVAPAATEQTASETEGTEKEVVKFADTMFQTMWINNAIGMYITEVGYEYPVEAIEMTTPVMQQSIVDGDVDVMLEIWPGNYAEWWSEVTSDGTLINLGNTYDKSTQGWYVPRYVIEGDAERGIEATAPDLKTVDDLAQYKEVFADPEEPSKGMITQFITGWDSAVINRIKIHAYGLDNDYNLMEPGASAALDAAIAGAYMKGDPILFYYWEPTWLIGLYDVVQIEEPAYSDECWEAINAAHSGDVALEDVAINAGCAYETLGVPKAIHPSLAERAPEIVEFFTKMNVGTDELNKTAAYMETEEVSANEAAVWYLNSFPEKWQAWVTEDAAAKINASLASE